MILRVHAPSSFSFCCFLCMTSIAPDIKFKFTGKRGEGMTQQCPFFCSREQKALPNPLADFCLLGKVVSCHPRSSEIGKENSLMEVGISAPQTKLKFCYPERWREWHLGRKSSVSAVPLWDSPVTESSQRISACSGVL